MILRRQRQNRYLKSTTFNSRCYRCRLEKDSLSCHSRNLYPHLLSLQLFSSKNKEDLLHLLPLLKLQHSVLLMMLFKKLEKKNLPANPRRTMSRVALQGRYFYRLLHKHCRYKLSRRVWRRVLRKIHNKEARLPSNASSMLLLLLLRIVNSPYFSHSFLTLMCVLDRSISPRAGLSRYCE